MKNYRLKFFCDFQTVYHDNTEEMNSSDISFSDFISFCRDNNFEFYIISDRSEDFIGKILSGNNISVKSFAALTKINPISGEEEIIYPYSDEYCRLCNNCLRNILITQTNDLENEISVFIGEGISDQCVSGFADIVFAKGNLASYCWKNNITYFEYNDFSDIKNKIIKLIAKRSLKHRNEAKTRRRDILMGG
ncbi:MAG: hypothetical protein JSS91_11490 [Bacteroidetes bacterium]|nr:hypothetical protein [Bacteroidota bacterium]